MDWAMTMAPLTLDHGKNGIVLKVAIAEKQGVIQSFWAVFLYSPRRIRTIGSKHSDHVNHPFKKYLEAPILVHSQYP